MTRLFYLKAHRPYDCVFHGYRNIGIFQDPSDLRFDQLMSKLASVFPLTWFYRIAVDVRWECFSLIMLFCWSPCNITRLGMGPMVLLVFRSCCVWVFVCVANPSPKQCSSSSLWLNRSSPTFQTNFGECKSQILFLYPASGLKDSLATETGASSISFETLLDYSIAL